MSDQIFTTLLSVIIGGVLTIVGGFLAAYYSQRLLSKAEKRKIVREKIEEIYILSNQLKYWIKVQLWRLIRDGNEGISGKFEFDVEFWHIDEAEHLDIDKGYVIVLLKE